MTNQRPPEMYCDRDWGVRVETLEDCLRAVLSNREFVRPVLKWGVPEKIEMPKLSNSDLAAVLNSQIKATYGIDAGITGEDIFVEGRLASVRKTVHVPRASDEIECAVAVTI
jgi:hypothetical protein